MSGAVEDTQMFSMVGFDVAQGKTYPKWKTDFECKVKRDVMMKGKAQ